MTDQQLLERVKKSEENYRFLRSSFEQDWYGNLLFKQGCQWIVWDTTHRAYRQKQLRSWVPMPVTNRFAATLDALVALLLRVEPPLQWSPQIETDQIQRSVAETANAVLDGLKEKTGFRFWRQRLATWMVYTGNGWIFNNYDPSGGSDMPIPVLECQECSYSALPDEFEQGCPECGSQAINHALDANGQVKEEMLKGGELVTEVGSPFEAFFDFQAASSGKLDELLRIRHRPLEYFQRYGTRGKEVQPSRSSTLSETYANALAYVASGASTGVGGGAANSKRPGASEYVYTCLPNDDHPDGIYLVMSGDTILEKSNLPSKDLKGELFIPAVHLKMDDIPGSGIGKTVASDLKPKQKQRNEIESLIQLIIMRMANPVWIVPYGVDVEGFSGEPGAVLKVFQLTPTGNNGPQRLSGENVPASVMQFLEKIDQDFEEISSVYETLKGSAPDGITAGYALQLLDERGMSRWGPAFQRWENGFIQWAEQVTAMSREHMPLLELRSLLGEHGDYEVQKFKEEPAHGFTIHAEAASLRPRSALTEQAQVEKANQQGLINLMDPLIRSKMLRNMGLSRYDHETHWDIKDAEREEQAFLEIAKQADVPTPEMMMGATRFRPTIDNHLFHVALHKRFAKTDAFMKLSSDWQTVWLKHLQMHVMMVAQSMMPQGHPGGPGGTANGNGKPSNFDGASDQGGRKMNPVVQEGAGAVAANPGAGLDADAGMF